MAVKTMLTAEQLLTMSLEQLLAVPFKDFLHIFQGDDQVERVEAHVETLLCSAVEPYLTDVRIAFDKKLPMTDLVQRFEKEPSAVKLQAWRKLTLTGMNQIDYVKFIHAHFAIVILSLFGDQLTNTANITTFRR